MRLNPSQLKAFKHWLRGQGAELLPATNEWEVVRFKCPVGTGVVYQNSRGGLAVNAPLVHEAADCFLDQKPWRGKGKVTKRSGMSKVKRNLLQRDGNECFYCGAPMDDDDVSVEHLLNVIYQGPNRIENLALAHPKCNQDAGNLSIVAKVKLRDKMRGANGDANKETEPSVASEAGRE